MNQLTTDPEPTTGRPARRGRGWIVGLTLAVTGVVGLGAWATVSSDSISYFVTPSELTAKPTDGVTRYRLGGRVAAGTLDRTDNRVTFTVSDEIQQVDVVYDGEIPDTLKEGTDVVAEGRVNADGVLVADKVLAKCSSKFVPAEEKSARERAS